MLLYLLTITQHRLCGGWIHKPTVPLNSPLWAHTGSQPSKWQKPASILGLYGVSEGAESWGTERQLIRKKGYLSKTLMLSVTGKPSAPHAREAAACVPVSLCPWINKVLISYTFLRPPHNDIPHGREHISAPAKHLLLLCCPSSSPCHPA